MSPRRTRPTVTYGLAERRTFVIAPDGTVEKVFLTPDPSGHVDLHFACNSIGAAPEQRFRVFDFADQADTALIERLAVVGRRDAARGAMKQPRPDTVL